MPITDLDSSCRIFNGKPILIRLMSTQFNKLDIKILNYLSSKFAGYIQFREKGIEEKKWNKLFKEEDKIIIKIYPNVRIFLYRNNILSKLIYKGFEQDELFFINSFLKKGDYFFDIGANVGLFSLIAANKIGEDGKVFSFEPTPDTFKKFEENITLNGFRNIIPLNIGLSHKEGDLKLKVSTSGYDAWNTFAAVEDSKFLNEILVPVKTLDVILKEHAVDLLKIRLVKIDVEGWEKFVLNGAKSLISAENAPVFLMEFTESNTYNAGYLCHELYDLMEDHGFKWYSYHKESNSLRWDKKRLHYPYNNLIAIKNADTVKSRIRIIG